MIEYSRHFRKKQNQRTEIIRNEIKESKVQTVDTSASVCVRCERIRMRRCCLIDDGSGGVVVGGSSGGVSGGGGGSSGGVSGGSSCGGLRGRL